MNFLNQLWNSLIGHLLISWNLYKLILLYLKNKTLKKKKHLSQSVNSINVF